ATARAVSRAASMSSPSAGLIWIVASRAIWFCQVAALSRTSVTAPSVRHDRKVMMAMTKIMELLATLPCGTIEVGRRRGGASAGLAWGRASSVMDFQPSARQHHPARVDLVHQGQVVRGEHHGGAEPVELEEKPQQAARQRRI